MKWFTKKRIIIIVVIFVFGVIGYFIFGNKNNGDSIQTGQVKKQALQATVLTTGQVVSQTDLSLGFKSSGVVQQIRVKEGDKVKAGGILATLDQKDQLASLTSARGALASAQANYEKVLHGATSEDIEVSRAAVAAAQATLDNAKNSYAVTVAQQKTAVNNALTALLNTSLTALALQSYDVTATLTISGTYTGTSMGEYRISLSSNGLGGYQYNVSGLETTLGTVQRGLTVPLGTRGLYMTFGTTGTLSAVDVWSVPVPNALSSSYTTNHNAYQAALQAQTAAVVAAENSVNAAAAALDQAKATLSLKEAVARPEDVAYAQAAVTSAQGQVAAAAASLENTIIRAPADGTITLVDIKVGEQATALQKVLVLQDVGNLHVEANVSEANIASLAPGQSVDFTFDALGPDRHFQGSLQTINPASTVVSGVVNYEVTASLENIPDIKPGMTANMTVLTASIDSALAVPQRAVITRDGRQFVRVIDDQKKKTYHEVEAQTGLQADGGLVEILSGLSEGQEVVTFIKQ